MKYKAVKLARPDAKGRISLGRIAEGVSSYTVSEENGRIILEPNIEILVREKWLFDNKAALNQLKNGLQDSAAGRIESQGSFAEFTDDAAK